MNKSYFESPTIYLLGVARAWLLTMCTVTTAHAIPITFTVTGTVDDIEVNSTGDPYVPGFPSQPTEFSIGDSFTFTYTFESSTSDLSTDSTTGAYSGALISATATVGGYTASATGGNINIYNNNSSTTDDSYLADAFPASGADIQGFQLNVIRIHLRDSSKTAHDSDALLLSPPTPVNYDLLRELKLQFYGISSMGDSLEASVRASVETITSDYNYDYDLNKDGEVNVGDLLLLQREILNLSP